MAENPALHHPLFRFLALRADLSHTSGELGNFIKQSPLNRIPVLSQNQRKQLATRCTRFISPRWFFQEIKCPIEYFNVDYTRLESQIGHSRFATLVMVLLLFMQSCMWKLDKAHNNSLDEFYYLLSKLKLLVETRHDLLISFAFAKLIKAVVKFDSRDAWKAIDGFIHDTGIVSLRTFSMLLVAFVQAYEFTPDVSDIIDNILFYVVQKFMPMMENIDTIQLCATIHRRLVQFNDISIKTLAVISTFDSSPSVQFLYESIAKECNNLLSSSNPPLTKHCVNLGFEGNPDLPFHILVTNTSYLEPIDQQFIGDVIKTSELLLWSNSDIQLAFINTIMNLESKNSAIKSAVFMFALHLLSKQPFQLLFPCLYNCDVFAHGFSVFNDEPLDSWIVDARNKIFNALEFTSFDLVYFTLQQASEDDHFYTETILRLCAKEIPHNLLVDMRIFKMTANALYRLEPKRNLAFFTLLNSIVFNPHVNALFEYDDFYSKFLSLYIDGELSDLIIYPLLSDLIKGHNPQLHLYIFKEMLEELTDCFVLEHITKLMTEVVIEYNSVGQHVQSVFNVFLKKAIEFRSKNVLLDYLQFTAITGLMAFHALDEAISTIGYSTDIEILLYGILRGSVVDYSPFLIRNASGLPFLAKYSEFDKFIHQMYTLASMCKQNLVVLHNSNFDFFLLNILLEGHGTLSGIDIFVADTNPEALDLLILISTFASSSVIIHRVLQFIDREDVLKRFGDALIDSFNQERKTVPIGMFRESLEMNSISLDHPFVFFFSVRIDHKLVSEYTSPFYLLSIIGRNHSICFYFQQTNFYIKYLQGDELTGVRAITNMNMSEPISAVVSMCLEGDTLNINVYEGGEFDSNYSFLSFLPEDKYEVRVSGCDFEGLRIGDENLEVGQLTDLLVGTDKSEFSKLLSTKGTDQHSPFELITSPLTKMRASLFDVAVSCDFADLLVERMESAQHFEYLVDIVLNLVKLSPEIQRRFTKTENLLVYMEGNEGLLTRQLLDKIIDTTLHITDTLLLGKWGHLLLFNFGLWRKFIHHLLDAALLFSEDKLIVMHIEDSILSELIRSRLNDTNVQQQNQIVNVLCAILPMSCSNSFVRTLISQLENVPDEDDVAELLDIFNYVDPQYFDQSYLMILNFVGSSSIKIVTSATVALITVTKDKALGILPLIASKIIEKEKVFTVLLSQLQNKPELYSVLCAISAGAAHEDLLEFLKCLQITTLPSFAAWFEPLLYLCTILDPSEIGQLSNKLFDVCQLTNSHQEVITLLSSLSSASCRSAQACLEHFLIQCEKQQVPDIYHLEVCLITIQIGHTAMVSDPIDYASFKELLIEEVSLKLGLSFDSLNQWTLSPVAKRIFNSSECPVELKSILQLLLQNDQMSPLALELSEPFLADFKSIYSESVQLLRSVLESFDNSFCDHPQNKLVDLDIKYRPVGFLHMPVTHYSQLSFDAPSNGDIISSHKSKIVFETVEYDCTLIFRTASLEIEIDGKTLHIDPCFLDLALVRQDNSLELFMANGMNFLVHILSGEPSRIVSLMSSYQLPNYCIVQRFYTNDLFKALDLTQKWKLCRLSNYEYISFLNLFSGRSFNQNLNPYIFPDLPQGLDNHCRNDDEEELYRYRVKFEDDSVTKALPKWIDQNFGVLSNNNRFIRLFDKHHPHRNKLQSIPFTVTKVLGGNLLIGRITQRSIHCLSTNHEVIFASIDGNIEKVAELNAPFNGFKCNSRGIICTNTKQQFIRIVSRKSNQEYHCRHDGLVLEDVKTGLIISWNCSLFFLSYATKQITHFAEVGDFIIQAASSRAWDTLVLQTTSGCLHFYSISDKRLRLVTTPLGTVPFIVFSNRYHHVIAVSGRTFHIFSVEGELIRSVDVPIIPVKCFVVSDTTSMDFIVVQNKENEVFLSQHLYPEKMERMAHIPCRLLSVVFHSTSQSLLLLNEKGGLTSIKPH